MGLLNEDLLLFPQRGVQGGALQLEVEAPLELAQVRILPDSDETNQVELRTDLAVGGGRRGRFCCPHRVA